MKNFFAHFCIQRTSIDVFLHRTATKHLLVTPSPQLASRTGRNIFHQFQN